MPGLLECASGKACPQYHVASCWDLGRISQFKAQLGRLGLVGPMENQMCAGERTGCPPGGPRLIVTWWWLSLGVKPWVGQISVWGL